MIISARLINQMVGINDSRYTYDSFIEAGGTSNDIAQCCTIPRSFASQSSRISRTFARSLARSKESFLSFKFTGIMRLARSFVTRDWTNHDGGDSVDLSAKVSDRRSRSKLIKRSLIALRKHASDRVYFQIRNDRLSKNLFASSEPFPSRQRATLFAPRDHNEIEYRPRQNVSTSEFTQRRQRAR